MNARREQWQYKDGSKVWLGRYRNSHNMPHWHYDCELLYVENGSLNIFCNGESYKVKEKQVFFIDSKQVHYMHALSTDTVVKMIIFDYDIIKPFVEKLILSSPLLSEDYGFLKMYEALKNELAAEKVLYGYVTALTVSLYIIEVFRKEQTAIKEKPAQVIERFKTLLSEIDEKYEFYDLNSAAEHMYMNPAYFSTLFHKLTGMTFSKYLNYVKCENAVAILNSGENVPITEIALRCGFGTIRNFNRIFKTYTGYTPKSLPKDFVMLESFTRLNESSQNPTAGECELLESSDD